MSDLAAFPDVEELLLDALGDLVVDPSTQIGTSTPPDLADHLPFIRVTRFGGSDDRIRDLARIDVDTFGPTRAVAQPLAEQVRQRLLSWPLVVTGGVIDRAETLTAPAEVPWDNQQIRRWTASYTVTCRRG